MFRRLVIVLPLVAVALVLSAPAVEATRIVEFDHQFVFGPVPGPPAVSPVPEPGSIVLLGTGACGLILRRWRKQKRP